MYRVYKELQGLLPVIVLKFVGPITVYRVNARYSYLCLFVLLNVIWLFLFFQMFVFDDVLHD